MADEDVRPGGLLHEPVLPFGAADRPDELPVLCIRGPDGRGQRLLITD